MTCSVILNLKDYFRLFTWQLCVISSAQEKLHIWGFFFPPLVRFIKPQWGNKEAKNLQPIFTFTDYLRSRWKDAYEILPIKFLLRFWASFWITRPISGVVGRGQHCFSTIEFHILVHTMVPAQFVVLFCLWLFEIRWPSVWEAFPTSWEDSRSLLGNQGFFRL